MKISIIYANPKLPKGAICPELELDNKTILATALALAIMGHPSPAMASPIADKVAKASAPIKDLLLGIADPVCYVVFCWGLLETMLGKGASGLARMKYAALGYAGLNWLPVLMEILRQAKP